MDQDHRLAIAWGSPIQIVDPQVVQEEIGALHAALIRPRLIALQASYGSFGDRLCRAICASPGQRTSRSGWLFRCDSDSPVRDSPPELLPTPFRWRRYRSPGPEPSCLTISVGGRPCFCNFSSRVLPVEVLMVLASTSLIISARYAGVSCSSPAGVAAFVDHAQHIVHQPVGDLLGIASIRLDRVLEIIRKTALAGQDIGVIFGQVILSMKRCAPFERAVRESPPGCAVCQASIQLNRQQVRLAEVAVIRLGFLGAHLAQRAAVLIPFQRPGFNRVAGFTTSRIWRSISFWMASRTASIELTFLISVLGLRYRLRLSGGWIHWHRSAGVPFSISASEMPIQRSSWRRRIRY